MTAERTTMAFGWRVYGLGVMAIAILCLTWGTFDPGSRCPRIFPTAPPYAAVAFMLVADAAIEWRRWVPMLLAAPGSHENWTESATTLALIGASWVVVDLPARPRLSSGATLKLGSRA